MSAAAIVVGNDHALVDAAGERTIDRNLVVVTRVRHRADERQLVGLLRNARQPVADLDARYRGGDRPKQTANAAGGLGLEVPHILLRRPAPQEQKETRFRPLLATWSWGALSRSGCGALGRKQPGQRQRPQPGLPETEQCFTANHASRSFKRESTGVNPRA